MNSVAVYTKTLSENIEKINSMRSNFADSDFFIFTDFFMQTTGIVDIGILSTFYMKFFKGTVYFLDKDDYEYHKNSTIANCILLEA